MQRLIQKIAERITAEYTRLSIVSNPDGVLTNPVVQSHLLSECGLNVVVGSQLQLRIHYELIRLCLSKYRHSVAGHGAGSENN